MQIIIKVNIIMINNNLTTTTKIIHFVILIKLFKYILFHLFKKYYNNK